ncbi:MAG: glycosyltransferase [Hyphomicrobiales bacterium]
MKRKVIVSVINDLATDQRVDKVCNTLNSFGFDVTLVGRKQKKSLPLKKRKYATHRMKLIWEKGPFFYMEYNIRLFLYLLFHRFDLLVSNDLDTLLANFITSKLKNKPLVYDSHEYYTETPELVNRKRIQKIWKTLEEWMFPKLIDVITVNESIANLFFEKYKKKVNIVRNVPRKRALSSSKSKQDLGMPLDKQVLILQSGGINVHRGVEELVEAMQYIDNAILYIIGSGDVINYIHKLVDHFNVKDKIILTGRIPFEELVDYTVNSDLGLTLDKGNNTNYLFSLPNKLFDYIQAGVPILSTRLPEIQRIIEHYDIGSFIDSHDPKHIAQRIQETLSDQAKLNYWKQNLHQAANELIWENEETVLKEIYNKYV